MAEFPGFTIWTDAYLGDTGHLTTLEHGAYLLLLMTMWRAGGSLPTDDKKLAKYAHLTVGQWGRIKATIMDFFTVEGEQITQRRLTAELGFVRQRSQRQSQNASAKSLKPKKPPKATAVPLDSQTSAPTLTPTPTYKDVPSEHRTAGPTSIDELCVVLDLNHSKAVVEHRRGFRGKFTPHAASLLAKEFAKCADPNAAADAMIANGWQGFKAEWMESRQRGSPMRQTSGLSAVTNDFRMELERDGYSDEGEEGGDPDADARLPLLAGPHH